MKRFWKWVLDRKMNTIQKWQSVGLNRDQLNVEQHLKPLAGSYDSLERKQKRNKKIYQAKKKGHRPSTSPQNLDAEFECEPIDFEVFFEESSSAIESALEKRNSSLISNQKNLSVPTELPSSTGEVDDDFSSELDDQPPSSQMNVETVPETQNRKITKPPELLVMDTDEKEKSNEKKKKSSLQQMTSSNPEVESSISTNRYMELMPSLTSAQIHLIRNIWHQVYITKGPTVIGAALMHRIFFKSRKIKDQFFKCSFPHQFPNHDCFSKAHSKALGEMLDKAMDNLENLDSVSGYLFSVGAMHANSAQSQVPKEIWNLMAEAFIDCTLDWGDKKSRTEASRKAWVLMISYVVDKMKRGYLHERRQLTYHKRSSAVTSFQTISSTGTGTSSLPSSVSAVKFLESVEKFN